MGGILLELNEIGDAKTVYRQAIGLKPDFADAYFNLATLHSFCNEVTLAIKMLRRAINLDPRFRETARTAPNFSSLHNKPAFRELLKK